MATCGLGFKVRAYCFRDWRAKGSAVDPPSSAKRRRRRNPKPKGRLITPISHNRITPMIPIINLLTRSP